MDASLTLTCQSLRPQWSCHPCSQPHHSESAVPVSGPLPSWLLGHTSRIYRCPPSPALKERTACIYFHHWWKFLFQEGHPSTCKLYNYWCTKSNNNLLFELCTRVVCWSSGSTTLARMLLPTEPMQLTSDMAPWNLYFKTSHKDRTSNGEYSCATVEPSKKDIFGNWTKKRTLKKMKPTCAGTWCCCLWNRGYRCHQNLGRCKTSMGRHQAPSPQAQPGPHEDQPSWCPSKHPQHTSRRSSCGNEVPRVGHRYVPNPVSVPACWCSRRFLTWNVQTRSVIVHVTIVQSVPENLQSIVCVIEMCIDVETNDYVTRN